MIKNKLLWLCLLFSGSYSYSANDTQEKQLIDQLGNALSENSEKKNTVIIALLVNQIYENGETLLHRAVRRGDERLVGFLMQAGLDVNKAQQNNITSLWIAAQNGYTKIAELLIKNRANVHQAYENGVTPLCVAAQNGHLETVKLLIEAQANLDQAHQDGATPLYIAAQNRHPKTVKLLIEAQAKVNQPRVDGNTPLYIATTKNYYTIFQLLVDAGANIDQPNNRNRTPLEQAVSIGNVKMINTLIEGYRYLLEQKLALSIIKNDEVEMLSAQSVVNIGRLPDEIIDQHIMRHLSPQDLSMFRLASKQCRLLACNQRIEQQKCNYKHRALNDIIRKELSKNKNIQSNVITILESYLQKEYVKKMMPTPKEVAPIQNRKCNIS